MSARKDAPRKLGRTAGFFIVPWVVLAVAIVAGVAFDLDARPYFAVLVATFAGVFAGGALALWSDRLQEASRRVAAEDRAEKVRRAADLAEMEKQRRVVGLLHDELSVSRDAMRDSAARARRPRPDLFYTPLPNSTWLALSASGELAHVPTPDLLGSLAEAYHWVGIVNGYERQMLDLQFHPAGVTGALASGGAGGPALRRALDSLKEKLEELDKPARDVITTAVEMADSEFTVITSAIASREAS